MQIKDAFNGQNEFWRQLVFSESERRHISRDGVVGQACMVRTGHSIERIMKVLSEECGPVSERDRTNDTRL